MIAQFKDFVAKVKEKENLMGDGDVLGRGSYGVAYKFSNKVLKLTYDRSEAKAAAKLKGVDNIKNVYKIYGVYSFKGTKVYAIVQELLVDPNEKIILATDFVGQVLTTLYEDAIYDWTGIMSLTNIVRRIKSRIYKIYHEHKEAFDKQPLFSLETTLGDSFDDEIFMSGIFDLLNIDFFGKYVKVINYKKYFNGKFSDFYSFLENDVIHEIQNNKKQSPFKEVDMIARAISKLNKNGIKFYDVHSGNVMQDASGEPVIIDLGLSRVSGGPPIDIIETYIRGILKNV